MSSQPRPTVKRKPPPSVDLRYPAPDPLDPFAPLWVLRSRSSNGALALAPAPPTLRGRKPSYNLYSAFLDDAPVLLKESHYRRRSQSTPPFHVAPGQVTVAFPAIQSNPYIYGNPDHPVPSLLTDHTSDSSGTDVDPVPAVANAKPVPPSWPSTPVRLARLLLPKRNRASLTRKPPIRVLALGISSPLHTQPGAPSGRATATARPSRKLTTSSSSSSFVHISSPSLSTTHSSTPDDSAHAYTSPRPAPAPTPPTTPKAIPTSTSAPLPSTHPPPHAHHARHPLSLSFHSPTPHPAPPPPTHPAEPEWSPPTQSQLARAAAIPVIAASGLRVPFGALFATRRTVVVFVRHFWCPLCQDYITSVVETAHRDVMFADPEPEPGSLRDREERSGDPREKGPMEQVDLVVISNGAPAFIPKYQQLFGLPFELYTDPTLAVYTALGMGRVLASPAQMHCASAGPGTSAGARMCTPPLPGVRDGGYVRHGAMAGIAMVVVRALRAGMPVWEKGGDIHQLGGEFVLGPGLRCTYAHRMHSPKGHAPIRDVLAAAGVHLPTPPPSRPPAPAPQITAMHTFGSTPAARLRRRNSTNAHNMHMQEFGAAGAWRRRSMATARTDGPRRASMAVLSPEEEAGWMQERMRSLERLRERKSERRGAFVGYHGSPSGSGVGTDAGAKESGKVQGEEGGGRTEGAYCPPVGEENAERGVNVGSAVDLAQVMVIGFTGGQAGTVDGDEDEGDDTTVSPTDATEGGGEREAP